MSRWTATPLHGSRRGSRKRRRGDRCQRRGRNPGVRGPAHPPRRPDRLGPGFMTSITWHGVTTALLGNCGVTFAPCKASDREFLAGMMETVEDIPRYAILTGLPWDWESYGGYLDSIERLGPMINVAGLVGHGATRFFVMGERAIDDAATPEEIERIAALAGQSVAEGAVGFLREPTSRAPPSRRAFDPRDVREPRGAARDLASGRQPRRPDADRAALRRPRHGDGHPRRGSAVEPRPLQRHLRTRAASSTNASATCAPGDST